ncbi:MAG TPA: hypothetical protein VI411_09985, partial [Actinomycetota bacterium]
MSSDSAPTSTEPGVAVGVIAAPGLPADLAKHLAGDLEKSLEERYPEGSWHVPLETDGLVTPPAA